MAISRYTRSLVQARALNPPFPLDPVEAKRYRAWQRHERRKRALDKLFGKLLWLNAERYRRELAFINDAANERIATVDDGDRCGYVQDINKR